MKPSKHLNMWKYSTVLTFLYALFFYLSFSFSCLSVMHVIFVTLTFFRVFKKSAANSLIYYFFFLFREQLNPVSGYCHLNYEKANILTQLWAV